MCLCRHLYTAAVDERAPIRKLMKRWEVPGGVRFITCSCQRRLPLLSHPVIAGLFVDAMVRARRKFGLELFAWVVMPEHIHMLVRPAEAVPLGPALHSLKMTVSKRVIPRWVARRASILDRIADGHGRPRFWQKGGGFDRNVRDDGEFCREVRYIHREPGRARAVGPAGGVAMVQRPVVDGLPRRRGRVRSAAGQPEVVAELEGVHVRFEGGRCRAPATRPRHRSLGADFGGTVGSRHMYGVALRCHRPACEVAQQVLNQTLCPAGCITPPTPPPLIIPSPIHTVPAVFGERIASY